MFLSRNLLSRLPAVGGLVVSTAALLLTAGPALAGREGPPSPPPPPAKAAPPALAPRPRAIPGPIQVTVTVPVGPRAQFVTLRTADGKVRRFEVEGGPGTVQVRQITVHPGESVTLNAPPAK